MNPEVKQNPVMRVFERAAGLEAYRQANEKMTKRYPENHSLQKSVAFALGVAQFVIPALTEWILDPKIKMEKLTVKQAAMGTLAAIMDAGFDIGTIILALNGNANGIRAKIAYNIGVGAINESRAIKK
jgi:hypothetical protein